MKDFFKRELETLYAKTQLRQYETLSAMPDAAKQISTMLDAMVRVCGYYPYIPDEAKKAIIQDRMLKDEDFIGFNAKIVSKWMEQAKDKYFKQDCHIKPEHEPKPVAYDDLNPELKKEVDAFIRGLASQENFRSVPHVSQKEIDDLKIEDLEEREGIKPLSIGVPLTTKEQAEQKELRRKWMLECFDVITGKPNDRHLDFETWLAQLGEVKQ
jgi:hypothetical protein